MEENKDVQPPEEKPMMEEEPKKGKGKKWLWIVIAALVVIVVLAAYLIPQTSFFQGWSTKGLRPTTEPLDQAALVANEKADLYAKFGGYDPYEDKLVSKVKDKILKAKNEFKNFDKKSVGFNKLANIEYKSELAEKYPKLAQKAIAEYKALESLSEVEVFEKAKVIEGKVIAPTPMETVEGIKKVWAASFVVEEGVEMLKTIEVFSPVADKYAALNLQVVVNGKAVPTEMLKSEEGIISISMLKPAELTESTTEVAILAKEADEKIVATGLLWDAKAVSEDVIFVAEEKLI